MKALNSLWARLTLIFTVVILIVVGAIAIWMNRATAAEFRQYITRSEVTAYGMESLAAYYRTHGGWEGVEELLNKGVVVTGSRWGMMRRPGMPEVRLSVVLADANGRIVFDGVGQRVGKRLRANELREAIPITEAGGDEVLGYVLIALPGAPQLGSSEQRFLTRTRGILISVAALAVVLGLVISAILSRSLTAPLQRLAAAARAVAQGDIGKRVSVEGTSEVAEVAQAFNEMTTALEKAEKLRQNLVSDVAHELRTPLSVLQGNLRAILDDVYPLDKAEIARLYDETRILARLVDDLQELAQAEAGALRFNIVPTDVASVLRSAVARFEPAAEGKSIRLTCEIPEALPEAMADPDRVSQILNNLISNALRHTPEGGQIALSAAAKEGFVEISVADTGEGIAPEDLPHVFDRFWRADRSRSRAGGGAGLGLAIVRALVEAQDGRVHAASEGPGKGSVFSFTLPTR
ncbi:MAG: HAMP domain-containing protein [Chloroflexi bacterium]|nr:HAMP domain-containing protein [Chloroflexota bacterium]